MKILLTVLLFLFYIPTFKAQNPTLQWARGIGGIGDDFGNSVAVDSYGNVYTTGKFQDTVDFDPGPGSYTLASAANSDIFILKLDMFGNFIWAKRIGDTGNDNGNSIKIDSAGNSYITGWFYGTADFDPGPGVFNLSAGSGEDAFILKLNSAGNFQWAKRIGNTSNICESLSITLDDINNIYFTGLFSGTHDFNPGPGIFNLSAAGNHDVFITKLDSLGSFVWAKSFGGTSFDAGVALTLDSLGFIYCTGAFNGVADFDPGASTFTINSYGNRDIFVSKLDTAGNFVWAKRIGSTSEDVSTAIAIDLSGDIYTVGAFKGITDFDPGLAVYTLTSAAGYFDIYVSKLNSSGNFVWAKSMGNIDTDCAFSVVTDASGNVYVTGNFLGTVDFDPGPGIHNLSAAGYTEIFILKLSASGNFIWVKQMMGSNHNSGQSITIDAYDNLYLTGYYGGIVDFDPGFGIYNLTGVSYNDIFIQKISQGITTKTNETNFAHTISLYPNPTTGIINIESESLNNRNTKIQILNSLGQIVFEDISIMKNSINIKQFSNGIYFLKIMSDTKIISTRKIIKE